jgi:hypothetical protein
LVTAGALEPGGRGPAPPRFAKCPFSGSKVPFSCVKNVIKIAFFGQRALLKTISGKFFGISGKLFSYLGKDVIYRENCFGMSRKIF